MSVPDEMYSKAEMEAMIAKMYLAASDFYPRAVQIGCHGFIEICGLMAEYARMCEASLAAGVQFPLANTHGSVSLAARPHQIAYFAEKLGCIFGSTFRAHPELWDVFKAKIEAEMKGGG